MTFEIDLVRNILQIVGAVFFVIGVGGSLLMYKASMHAVDDMTVEHARQYWMAAIFNAVLFSSLTISGSVFLTGALLFR